MVLVLLAAGTLSACTTSDPGKIGVVRNGSVFLPDNKNIRSGDSGLQCPGASGQFNGFGSTINWYPDSTTQRTFKFDDERNANPDAEPRVIDSKDNIRMTLRGTIYLTYKFDCTAQGKANVKAFDTITASRPKEFKPSENFGAWQVNDLLPIIDRSLRSLSAYNAYQLVPRAAQVQNVSAKVQQERASTKPVSPEEIADTFAKAFRANARATFRGHDFFAVGGIKLLLNKPELSGEVNQAIEGVQAAFTNVSRAQAQLDAAEKQVQVSIKKQESYDKCPSCARQDEAVAFNQSLPSGVTSVAYGIPTTGR